MTGGATMEGKILGSGDKKRDQTIVKTCDVCLIKYHPRKNGYELISRFCSQLCARKGRKLTSFNRGR
jgi:hypothetical protein